MTTGHRIEPKVLWKQKRPKSTASNSRITREPFGNLPEKELPIPAFIDDYNHYMAGIDQANQLWAAFTTHFPWNQKEFFSGAFWSIDIAISNSYKLHLALNGLATSQSGKRDPQQHREWIEDLVNLLFQVDSDDFGEEIAFKPYPKYVYQNPKIGPKMEEKKAFLKTINRDLNDHLYDLNPYGKRGFCFLCPKKDNLNIQKRQKSANFLFQKVYEFNQQNLIEIQRDKQSKQERFRGKSTKWWCKECNKFIC